MEFSPEILVNWSLSPRLNAFTKFEIHEFAVVSKAANIGCDNYFSIIFLNREYIMEEWKEIDERKGGH